MRLNIKPRTRQLLFSLTLILAWTSVAFAQSDRLAPEPRERPVRFVMDIRPVGILFSSDIDGFRTTRTHDWGLEFEELVGTESLFPWARIGVGFNSRPMHLDVTVGGGYLGNDAFETSFASMDVAASFKLGPAITLGPHIGVVSFGDPKWQGDSDIKLKGDHGVLCGIRFTAGGRKFGFSGSIDYLSGASFKVERGGLWTANADKLDLDGVAIQLGINFRF